MEVFKIDVGSVLTLKGVSFDVPEPKAWVVLITGMDEYARRYAGFAKHLNEAGYSVRVLDHFGQGENVTRPEDQEIVPHGSWDGEIEGLYQLAQEGRKKGIPVYLIGHSMGSFSVQSYLTRHPGTVDKAVLIGSNGPNNKTTIQMGRMLAKMRTHASNWDKLDPKMDKMALGGYNKGIANPRTDFDWLSVDEKNVDAYIQDPYCGHANTHGFYVEMMGGMKDMYTSKRLKALSPKESILILSGAEDPVGANGKGARSLKKMYQDHGITDVRAVLYPHMRHEIHNETHSELFFRDLLAFLEKGKEATFENEI